MDGKGKTSIDPEGSRERKYRSIACLPLMWKLLTSVMVEKVYVHLSEKNVPPDEQKGCRKDLRGTKEQLLIDKQILKHCKKHKRNLAMEWIDYKKAYTMVPHRWMIEAMKMVGIAVNIVNLFENSKETCTTELIACNESLEEVDIRRGISQGDYFSPLLFAVAVIPLSLILNETDLGYVTSRNQKLNHLLLMDALKLYAKSERELDSLIQTVRIFSDDVGMVFGLDKCAVLVLKRGKIVQTDGIELPDGKRMREVNLDGHKYLGVLQLDFIMNREMKEKGKSDYIRRVKKLMTMNGSLYPRGNVGRLYLTTREGGRGLISCEECVNVEVQSWDKYLSESEEWMLKFVAGEKGLSEVEDPDAFEKR